MKFCLPHSSLNYTRFDDFLEKCTLQWPRTRHTTLMWEAHFIKLILHVPKYRSFVRTIFHINSSHLVTTAFLWKYEMEDDESLSTWNWWFARLSRSSEDLPYNFIKDLRKRRRSGRSWIFLKRKAPTDKKKARTCCFRGCARDPTKRLV